ncbi:MAG: hypothetical protein H7Y38_19955 [Armatimonadetes bacterium]|nr:hypothetical protein [Armatimonadota bacterium]
MKRWGRVVLTFALLALLVWGVRAAYLFRVWQIATLWANAPPVPPPIGAFFAPDTWGTTRHGAYADAVFLRVSLGDRAASFASAVRATPMETPTAVTDGCAADGWGRNYPPRILPHNLAPCYGVAEAFDVPVGLPLSRITDTGRGGTVWVSGDTLYIAAYQTR